MATTKRGLGKIDLNVRVNFSKRNPSSSHVGDDIDIERDAYQARQRLMRDTGISLKTANTIERATLAEQYRIATEYRDVPRGKFSVWIRGWKNYGQRNPAKPVSQITDRAKSYRAQNNVKGPRKCVFCGATKDLHVMHLDGNESHGETKNLAYGCRSCNTRLGIAFKKIGAGVKTRQYNPSAGVPTFQQYAWAVSQQRHSGEHGEAGAIIHATPKHKRTEYALRILAGRYGGRDSVPF